MASNSATSDAAHGLIKFIGFAGVIAILGIAISLGKTKQIIEDTSVITKTNQHQIEEITADLKVEQQEIVELDRRVTRVEDKK